MILFAAGILMGVVCALLPTMISFFLGMAGGAVSTAYAITRVERQYESLTRHYVKIQVVWIRYLVGFIIGMGGYYMVVGG